MSANTVTTRTPLDSCLEQALDRLTSAPVCGYTPGGPAASEPTAWSALALWASGRKEPALQAAECLLGNQQRNGAVGVTPEDDLPAWTTSLAMLAWSAIDQKRYDEAIKRGASWALGQKPWTAPPKPIFGHDTSIEGWSWAPDTHSWIEPTAFFVLAMKKTGIGANPRACQGVEMLVDRLLPSGGANYGNTIVMGQELLQHLQPSGIVAWTLAEERLESDPWRNTLDYLHRAAREPTGVASLCYAVLGLAANGEDLTGLEEPLAEAGRRQLEDGGAYKLALFVLATLALQGNAVAWDLAQPGETA